MEDDDGSSRLDYANKEALSAGSWDIRRASTSPITPADLTLPARGTAGSLGWSAEIVVDTTALFVVDVRVRILAPSNPIKNEKIACDFAPFFFYSRSCMAGS